MMTTLVARWPVAASTMAVVRVSVVGLASGLPTSLAVAAGWPVGAGRIAAGRRGAARRRGRAARHPAVGADLVEPPVLASELGRPRGSVGGGSLLARSGGPTAAASQGRGRVGKPRQELLPGPLPSAFPPPEPVISPRPRSPPSRVSANDERHRPLDQLYRGEHPQTRVIRQLGRRERPRLRRSRARGRPTSRWRGRCRSGLRTGGDEPGARPWPSGGTGLPLRSVHRP
jgi:hypothetical protein